MKFKSWMKLQEHLVGGPGFLMYPKVGDRSYDAAGIRNKWTSSGMKKSMKKKSKKD